MRDIIAAMGDGDDLARYGSLPDGQFFIDSQFRKGAASSKAFAAFLATKKPSNLTNGATIDVGQVLSAYNRKEFHHLFPKAYLKNASVSNALANALGNICMLGSGENKNIGDRAPSKYVAQLQSDLGGAFDDVMDSNFLSKQVVEMMLQEDYAGFLEARADTLQEAVARLA